MERRKLPFASLLFSRVAGDPKPPFSSSSPSLWLWPSCSKPKTHSFRAIPSPLPTSLESSGEEGSETYFAPSERLAEETAAEAVLHGLRSDRLFFDPGGGANGSITADGRVAGFEEEESVGFDGGVAVAMESTDPYRDFRASMEEMVEAHGARDWEWLQELLVWFLRANAKGTHGLIVGAFLDLLLGFAASSPSFFSAPNDNPLCSSCSSNSSSYTFQIEEVGLGMEKNGNHD